MTQQSHKVTQDEAEIDLSTAFAQHPVLARIVIFLGFMIMGMIGLILYKLANPDDPGETAAAAMPVVPPAALNEVRTGPALATISEEAITKLIGEGSILTSYHMDAGVLLLEFKDPSLKQPLLILIDLSTGAAQKLSFP